MGSYIEDKTEIRWTGICKRSTT